MHYRYPLAVTWLCALPLGHALAQSCFLSIEHLALCVGPGCKGIVYYETCGYKDSPNSWVSGGRIGCCQTTLAAFYEDYGQVCVKYDIKEKPPLSNRLAKYYVPSIEGGMKAEYIEIKACPGVQSVSPQE